MADPGVKNMERRSFFKWALFGLSALMASITGYGPALLGKEKDLMVSSLTDAAEVITDASRGNHHRLTATRDFLLRNPVNAVNGQRIVWEIVQDKIGGHKMVLDDKFAFGADLTKVELTAAPHKRDFLTAIYNAATDKWYVVAFIRGY